MVNLYAAHCAQKFGGCLESAEGNVYPEEGSSSQPTLSTPYQSWATKTDSTKVSPPPGYPVVMSNPREVAHDPEIAVVSKSFDGLSTSDHKTAWLSLNAMAIVVVSSFFGSSDPFHSTLPCPQR